MIYWQKPWWYVLINFINCLVLIKRVLFLVVCTYCFILQTNLLARPAIQKYDKNQQRIFEFLADNVSHEDSKVIGEGNVVIINEDYYLTTQKAIYDINTQEIDLEGDVRVFKGNSLYLQSQKVRVRLKEDSSILEPFYLQDSTSGFWVSAECASMDRQTYKTSGAFVSSCSVNNPIWKIKVSSGEFDSQKSWAWLWNPRVYIYDFPVFYFPYLSFSTAFSRLSGILYPYVGNSSNDGLLYGQPIFFAQQTWWDMTLTPQIRTKRGYGVYGEFRLIDDKDSSLWVNTGIFEDMDSYQNKYNLKNQTHLGFQAQYQRKNLLTNGNDGYFNDDGIFIDVTQLNDIDYLRLQDDMQGLRDVNLQQQLITSSVNYFLQSNEDYIGIYGRYYTDLGKASNADTFQTLPALQYHRYLQSIPYTPILYGIDVQTKNFQRQTGFLAFLQEVSIPFFYSQSFLDDYMHIQLNPTLYAAKLNYRGYGAEDFRYDNGSYLSSALEASISSDLAKPYRDFFHTINLNVSYKEPKTYTNEGDFSQLLVFPDNRSRVSFAMSQYFYNTSLDLKLYHKIQQNIYLRESEFQYSDDLENEVQYFFNQSWSFLSSIFYSHNLGKISESTHQIGYNDEWFNIYFGHFYRRFDRGVFGNVNRVSFESANFLRAHLEYRFNNLYLFGSVGYNLEDNFFRTWSVGFYKEIQCFGFGIRYIKEIKPVLTNEGAVSVDDSYVLFEIKFLPIVSSNVRW